MAYLVHCPTCSAPKRVDLKSYDPTDRVYAFKYPDGGMWLWPPETYECPRCGERYALGSDKADAKPEPPASQPNLLIQITDVAVPWVPWDGTKPVIS